MSANVIPPITDDLGRYGAWSQPKPGDIKLEGEYAEMGLAVFERLHEYSASVPTGRYSGKMWKMNASRRLGVFSVPYDENGEVWYLRWYGVVDDENRLAIYSRRIRIVG